MKKHSQNTKVQYDMSGTYENVLEALLVWEHQVLKAIYGSGLKHLQL